MSKRIGERILLALREFNRKLASGEPMKVTTIVLVKSEDQSPLAFPTEFAASTEKLFRSGKK